MSELTKKSDCLKCRYFEVTWNVNFPRSCKLFGFMTRSMPCDVVFKETGHLCVSYEEGRKPAASAR